MTRAVLPGRLQKLAVGISAAHRGYKPHLEGNDMFKELCWRIGAIWCKLTHQSLMWPAHGHYQCRRCGRRYPAFAEQMANQTTRAALRYADY